MSDDEDPLAQHLNLITKRVDRYVNGRLQAYADHLVTLVGDVNEIRNKMNRIEAIINMQVQNNVYLMRNVNLVTQELDALEVYLSKTDPELKKLLLDCLDRQRDEITRREKNGK